MLTDLEEIKNRLDIADVIQQYLRLDKAGANWKARCPFHNEKTPSFMVSSDKQIWHCFGCFPPGSLIKSKNGYHKIEEVKKGDLVLTHKGRFMPVIRSLWRPYRGDMIDIRLRKSSEKLSLTGDHQVFVIRTENCKQKSRRTRICQSNCKQNCPTKFFRDYKIEKIPARNLSINDYLLYPISEEVVDVRELDLEKYHNRRQTNYGPKISFLPTIIKVDNNFLKLLGYYIAEGSNHRAYIRFSLGNHEKEFAEEILTLGQKIFGLKGSIYKRQEGNKTGIEVTICNSKLANIFENLCGKGANNKYIPFDLQFLPPDKQRIILEAIFKGDGTTFKINKCKTKRYGKSTTTVSLILMEQIRDMLLRNGITPTTSIQNSFVDKKNVSHKTAYTISWQENYKLNFSSLYRDSASGILYWLLPIKEIKRRMYSGNVFNLTVQNDHSYIASLVTVGNCGEGGDIFSFVMKIEGVEFKEALRTLAEKAGVKLQYSKGYTETRDKRDTLYEINEWAVKFYEKQLWANTQTSGKVLDYLLKRGLKKETIKNFRLGYAPKEWHSLQAFLNSKGYNDGDIEEAGLVIKSKIQNPKSETNSKFKIQNSKFHDRFRGRIMFPICDIQGRVAGFTGRVFEPLFKKEELENQGKYINSPETLIYNKSNILYGLYKAKVSLRKNNLCVLVEGNMDLIMSHQAGIDNVVAVSGTALTNKQTQIIKRYAENIAIAFDSDEAGNVAAKRSVDLATLEGLNVKIIDVAAGITSPRRSIKDPADILQEKGGAEIWKNAINKARGAMDFYFHDAFSKFKPNSAESKREIAKLLLPVIKKIPNKVEQHHWLHILADKINIKEEFLIEALNSVKARTHDHRSSPAALQSQEGNDDTGNRDQLGENFLGLIFKYYEEGYNDINLPEELFFMDERISMIYQSFIDTIKRKKKIKDFYNVLIYENQNFVNKLMFIVEERWSVSDGGGLDFLSIKNDINFLLESLRLRKIKQDLNNLASDIKQAEKDGDKTALKLLKEEFGKLANKLPR